MNGKYTWNEIAQELQDTAQRKAYYGNALRVAKDIDVVNSGDRSVLDKYLTRYNLCTIDDRMRLQDIAIKIRLKEKNK